MVADLFFFHSVLYKNLYNFLDRGFCIVAFAYNRVEPLKFLSLWLIEDFWVIKDNMITQQPM